MTIHSDDFNRADEALAASPNWVDSSGTFSVASNQVAAAVAASGAVTVYQQDLIAEEIYCKATLDVPSLPDSTTFGFYFGNAGGTDGYVVLVKNEQNGPEYYLEIRTGTVDPAGISLEPDVVVVRYTGYLLDTGLKVGVALKRHDYTNDLGLFVFPDPAQIIGYGLFLPFGNTTSKGSYAGLCQGDAAQATGTWDDFAACPFSEYPGT